MGQTGTKPRKGKLIKRVLIALVTVIFIFILSIFLVAVALNVVSNTNTSISNNSFTDTIMDMVFPPIRERTNALILGTDNGALTDVIMVASFNSATGRVDIISIPRDTRVVMPPDRVNSIASLGRRVPPGGVMKFNEIHAYAGAGVGVQYVIAEVEDLLGLEIHYYARVSLQAFRFIVDEIGGVEFYVPQRMFYRGEDILIDLQPGWQVLNGAQAEALVRFRGYPEGDLQRIRVQQDFILAMAQQVTSSQNIINNATAIITAVINYVDTNFKIEYVPQYIRYANMVSPNNIHMHTMPGTPQFIGGISYVIPNQEAINELINSILFGPTRTEAISSQNKSIQVLNGSNVAGAAASTRDTLENNGFNVLNIGNYDGVKEEQTRIFVKTPGEGEDIRALIPGSRIVLDRNMDKNYDIIVVVGTN